MSLGLGATDGSPKAVTPEEVVTKYFERVRADGLGSVADMMHPDELNKLRQMMEPVVAASLAEKDDTFELFADAADPLKVSAMDDVKFMNTFMTWTTFKVPGVSAALRNASMEALGHVVEGEVKHVVVRSKTKLENVEIEKMSVWSVKDYEGRPMLMMMGDFKGTAEQLRRRR
jgi:hypothetical protein